MPIITLANGKAFPAETSEAMLSAALRSDILLEHSCKTGRCGSCKVQLSSGSTTPILDEIGLNQAERDAGWILSCVRSANSDVQLDIEDLGDIEIFPTKTLPCRIQLLERLSSDVLRVILGGAGACNVDPARTAPSKCANRAMERPLQKKPVPKKIRKFTGISSPYKAPENLEMTVNTGSDKLDTCLDQVMKLMSHRGVLLSPSLL